MKQKICLCMIVKDEESCIKRCLDSVKSLIDHWIIVDTGSSDNTKQIISQTLADIPGELHERPWVNFSHNRNETVELANNALSDDDYIFVIDADDTLIHYYKFPILTKDAYLMQVTSGHHSWERFQLFRAKFGFHYDSPVHEYLTNDRQFTHELLKNFEYRCGDGKSNRRGKERFVEDARMLEEALKTDPDNGRHIFYLAQSYYSAGMYNKAIETYKKRLTIGGTVWEQEKFLSLMKIGKLQDQLGEKFEVVRDSFLLALDYNSDRGTEALYELSKLYFRQGNHEAAYGCARAGATIPIPLEGLFVDRDVYNYLIYDQLAITAHATGRISEAIDITQQLLDNAGPLPEDIPVLQKRLEQWKNT